MGWPVTLTARVVLGGIFVFSGAMKITDIGMFQANVEAYRLLPVAFIAPFAIALPWIELLVGIYLVIGLFLRPTAIAAALLLAMFAAAITQNILTGNIEHSCGCLPDHGIVAALPFLVWIFGGATLTPFDVIRDVGFIGVAALVYWGDRSVWSLDGILFGRPQQPADGADADADSRHAATHPAGSSNSERTAI